MAWAVVVVVLASERLVAVGSQAAEAAARSAGVCVVGGMATSTLASPRRARSRMSPALPVHAEWCLRMSGADTAQATRRVSGACEPQRNMDLRVCVAFENKVKIK